MAHSPAALNKLETFLALAARSDLQHLAQQHLALGEELLETEDTAAALCQRALIAAVDAIGKVKFPREWERARDNIGHDQTERA